MSQNPEHLRGDRFEVLADLIETYESRYWPIEAASPVDILREFMKTRNFDQGDLGKLLGSKVPRLRSAQRPTAPVARNDPPDQLWLAHSSGRPRLTLSTAEEVGGLA